MILFYFILFFVLCVVLARCGAMIVKSLTRISAHYHLSEFIVAFVLTSIVTTAPEFFIGVSSALSGTPSLSLGNLIGANVVHLTLILGLVALLGRGIEITTHIAKRDAILTFILLVLPLLLLADQTLSRLDGLILLAVFLIYLWHLFYSYYKRPPYFIARVLNFLRVPVSHQEFKREFERPVSQDDQGGKIGKDFIKLAFGFILLIVSARVVVYLALKLAIQLGLPAVLLGLMVLSIGTTLPELTFGISAVLAKRKEMVLGNLFGAMVINLVYILGVVALVHPIILSLEAFRLFLFSALTLFVMLGLFMIFIHTKSRLSWQEGLVLVLGYVVFVLTGILVK